MGDAVTYRSVLLTPDRAVLVRALARDIVLCPWTSHFTLIVPLLTQVYELVPWNLMFGLGEGVILFWTSIPSKERRMLHRPVPTQLHSYTTQLHSYTLVTSRFAQVLRVSLGGART